MVISVHFNCLEWAGTARRKEHVQDELKALKKKSKDLKKKSKKEEHAPSSSSSTAAPPRTFFTTNLKEYASDDDKDLDEFCEDIKYTLDPASLTSADEYAAFHHMACDRP